MLHRKCKNCGTEQKTWVSFIDIAIGLTLLTLVITLQIHGYYTRPNIEISQCDNTIIGIDDNTLTIPISIQEAITPQGDLDTNKVREIAKKEGLIK